ncbi:glycosyltransferase family 2 protein [Cognatilysobacter lacus]|uniref:glycosyltransferase family 2 protein n=1 Tax=Cognatilysobacter lacus TaxID=1643323 RepID=UPI0016598710|nr:glycosyltransferase family 2 protein [Lysobacter lacus]
MTDPDAPRPAPWLSLLLPVYNVRPWLGACVDSILAQGVGGIEIVLVDDVSTDGSVELARELQAAHPGVVRVIAHDLNRGVSCARNTLIANARGDYLWFVDSDDLLCDGALASLRAIIDAHAPDLVLCDYRLVRSPFRLKHRLRGELHRRTFHGPARTLLRDRSVLIEGVLSQGQLHVWSKIARRCIWEHVHFPEGRYFEDIAAMPPLFALSRTFYYAPEPWIGYRQRPGSIMRSMSPDKLEHLNRAVVELHAAITEGDYELDERGRFAVDYFCLKTYASLARRFDRGLLAEQPDARRLCAQSLQAMFPGGVESVLSAYGRRGWHMRRLRTRYYLGRLGWLAR